MKQSVGFVYLWKDTKRNKFYLGSHLGCPNDGYIGSNNRLLCAYKSRPDTFKRRILEQHQSITSKDLLKKEEAWLQLIKIEELGTKYYNEKRVAAGGDIVSYLSEDKRKQHKEKSIATRQKGLKAWREKNPEKVSEIARANRAKVKNPSGGSMPGESNPFYHKTHTQKHKDYIAKRNKIEKWRQLQYKITFANGDTEIIAGAKNIRAKYCNDVSIKFERFIGTGVKIESNRKKAQDNKLYGAIIEVVA